MIFSQHTKHTYTCGCPWFVLLLEDRGVGLVLVAKGGWNRGLLAAGHVEGAAERRMVLVLFSYLQTLAGYAIS